MSPSLKGLVTGVVALGLFYAIWQWVAVTFVRNFDAQGASALQWIDLMSILPFLAFVVSGFLAARVAGTAGLVHGFVIAVSGSALFHWYSIGRLFSDGYPEPVHGLLMSFIAVVLAGGVGQLYADRRKA